MDADLFFERVEPADSGREDRSEPAGVDTDCVDTADLVECLACGGECELLDAVSAAGLFGSVEVGSAVPIVEHDGSTDGRGRAIEASPEVAGPDAGRSNDTQASDGDPAAARHQSLPATRS